MNYSSVVVEPGMSQDEIGHVANIIVDLLIDVEVASGELEDAINNWIRTDEMREFKIVLAAQHRFNTLSQEYARLESEWDEIMGDELVWVVASANSRTPGVLIVGNIPSISEPGQLPFQTEARPVENLEELLQEMLGE